MRLPVKHVLPLAALMLLAGAKAPPTPPPTPTGPAADYPMVIGAPFVVDGKTYTPADRLNSDEVGYASIGEAGGDRVTGAHKTLPLPTYVEVTSLESGKTILVRLERRGPMSNDLLAELSPGAAAQLGISGGARAPVRVRRVNPPEQDRALLRAGNRAPYRMETPKGLLAVLTRKLDGTAPAASASLPPAEAAAVPPPKPKPAPKPAAAPPPPEPAPAPNPAPVAAVPKPAVNGSFTVQVAAFSTEDRARNATTKLAGKVSKPGRFWLVQLGPYATRADAQAALAKARAAGYSDARIQRAD